MFIVGKFTGLKTTSADISFTSKTSPVLKILLVKSSLFLPFWLAWSLAID
jgi:hypothetical protein